MADQKTYSVFISSTFIDNRERRKVVEDAILSAGMTPVGMERFTANKQKTVKWCKEKAAECDLFVGIIAWRYGWIPKALKTSITELEYNAAKKADKDRLMFVIDESLPVNPNKDFDDKDTWDKQKKLEAFKNRFSKDQLPAHFIETTLGTRVLQALHDWVAMQKTLSKKSRKKRKTTRCSISKDKNFSAYCTNVDSLHSYLPVVGFVKQLKVKIDLGDIYVPLRAMINLHRKNEKSFFSAEQADKKLGGMRGENEIALPEAFRQTEIKNRRGLVILGDPGSGKTTHMKRLLLWCIRKGSESIGLPRDMIPIFLPLRELKDAKVGFTGFVRQQLEHPSLSMPKGFGTKVINRGNLLFLLDGLDEVSNLAEREKVAQWIEKAANTKRYGDCRFVVTSRYAGYSPTVAFSLSFLEMHLRPLTAEQAELFIHNWYQAVEVGGDKDASLALSNATERAEDLIATLKEPDFRAQRVFTMTRNPLLLTNLCLVHRHRVKLPEKRARLYDECVDVLLEHWREASGLSLGIDAQDGKRVLQPAAYWMHSKEGRTRAKQKELSPVIEPHLKASGWEGGSAADFLTKVRDVSGLLTGWDQEHYGFLHLGFQEFLAAREIRSQVIKQPILKELASHFGESWWEEVILLFLAIDDQGLFEPFMREVTKLPAFVEHSRLIELCVEDAAEVSIAPFLELLEQPAGKARALWKKQILALYTVARINPEVIKKFANTLKKHPYAPIREWFISRQKVAAKHAKQDVIYTSPGNVELVRIPSGSFMMGMPDNCMEKLEQEYRKFLRPSEWKRRLKRERPQHHVDISSFYMGRYPVTNEEYGRFLKENPKAKEPRFWADRKWNQSKQPVVGVNWNDARAFAEWAECRLPSEAEWEYACRAGTEGSCYGDLSKISWYELEHIDRTQPVGQKESNAFGLYDTLGNVWEWNEDDWHMDYEGAPLDGRAWINKKRRHKRIARGGAWNSDSFQISAHYRISEIVDVRDNMSGFRVARDLK